MNSFILFSGTSNLALATAIAHELGVPLGDCTMTQFPDGEVAIELREPVRGKTVFLIQSTAPPVNDHLVELLVLADACRRSAAHQIIAVVPYFGYARSDKRHGRREPISASMVAGLMQSVGIHQVITLDLHAAQIEGFFHIPLDSLTAVPTFCEILHDRFPPNGVVVSPDAGRVAMATQYAQRLDCPVIVLHKHRSSGTETAVTRIVGDVRDRPCLIIDDMISTGGTLARSIEALLNAGALPEMTIAATHGLFISEARAKLSHPSVKGICVSDSVAPPTEPWPLLQVISIAPLLASAIQQVTIGGSLSALF